MVNLTLGLHYDDALAMLRTHATTQGRSLDELACDVACGCVGLQTLGAN